LRAFLYTMSFKSGFVNIIGNPNVGKSTLMNALLGEKLSIVTPKAQTTRHRILGILEEEGYQIIFSDTPGILNPHYRMQESMMKAVNEAISDADVILYITDVNETTDKYPEVLKTISTLDIPVLVLINKIDLTQQEPLNLLMKEWQQRLPKAEVIPISALHQKDFQGLTKQILDLLPDHPPYYPPGELTDRPERFFVAEIIREKIFMNYAQEIPYSSQVEITSFKEEPNLNRISAIIYVMRDSQKGILIGKKGEALKKTGTMARLDIEAFLGKKVFLELTVKVRENWRDQPIQLRRFGYEI